MTRPTYAFVEVKAFGDLVMAAWALRLLPPSELARCHLVIGPYLKDLAEVLSPGCEVEVLDTSDRTVPDAFDMKRAGLIKGVRSMLALRDAVSRAARGAAVVMESDERRERFIAGRHPFDPIPRKDNVYLGFEAYVARTFGPLPPPLPLINAPAHPRRVAICPVSRLDFKNVPPAVVVDMARTCEAAGLEVELLLLEGERFAYPEAPRIRMIPRRFDALGAALSEYGAVISADSLPAHLAEYQGTPTFIASPVDNCYWFPKRAFLGDHWGRFADRNIAQRLQRFLDVLRP